MNEAADIAISSKQADADVRLALLERFEVKDIQNLGPEELLAAQRLAGHGNRLGEWIVLDNGLGGVAKKYKKIDLRIRLRHFLKAERSSGNIEQLVEEGVLVLTRWSLLLRMTPSSRFRGVTSPLKPTSIAFSLYSILPRLAARAIVRKLSAIERKGFFRFLTEPDLNEFEAIKTLRIELDRLRLLCARGLWSDVPFRQERTRTTDPAQLISRPLKPRSQPFPPIPDAWLAEIGPKVLWVVEELGPSLLRMLEDFREEVKEINWSKGVSQISPDIQELISDCLNRNPWLDRLGKPLLPPFLLRSSSGRFGKLRNEWPPRTWEQITTLSITLQSCHLFITLLASAARISEVAALKRGCISIERDGKGYVNGYTYKLSSSLFGEARKWPAPPILCRVIGQQARLAGSWGLLPKSLSNGLPIEPRFDDALWVSIGNGLRRENPVIDYNGALMHLCERFGIDSRPGGKRIHSHRFRKTIGRLAGVALFNSPLVLKKLFGHKSVEMTLHYILCDEDIREEVEVVLRELRIMHCAEALEEIHHALSNGLPLPANGGAGASRLGAAVKKREMELEQRGRVWRDGSAYDLACLLTMNGQGWRLIQQNIVCSKVPGEAGLCRKSLSKGEPNTANCQPSCDNRIVLACKRRDVELSIEQYLDIARQARDEGQLLVLASVMHNVQQAWIDFADLEEKYLADAEVQALLALCNE